MPKVTWIGSFRELADPEEREGLPSLRDFISDTPQDNEVRILAYLESAPGIAGRGSVEGDVLDPDAPVAIFRSIFSDGVFIWSQNLAYYVRRYHLRLPPEVVAHMAAMNWTPPPKGSINPAEIDW